MIASGASVADVARVVRPLREELYANYIDPAIPVIVQQEKGGLLTPDDLRRRLKES